MIIINIINLGLKITTTLFLSVVVFLLINNTELLIQAVIFLSPYILIIVLLVKFSRENKKNEKKFFKQRYGLDKNLNNEKIIKLIEYIKKKDSIKFSIQNKKIINFDIEESINEFFPYNKYILDFSKQEIEKKHINLSDDTQIIKYCKSKIREKDNIFYYKILQLFNKIKNKTDITYRQVLTSDFIGFYFKALYFNKTKKGWYDKGLIEISQSSSFNILMNIYHSIIKNNFNREYSVRAIRIAGKLEVVSFINKNSYSVINKIINTSNKINKLNYLDNKIGQCIKEHLCLLLIDIDSILGEKELPKNYHNNALIKKIKALNYKKNIDIES